jgi:VanZ family protein
MNMIRIALAYIALFAAIVIVADANWMPPFAQRLHDLPYGDKVIHFTLFGVLALVANLALASRGRRPLAGAMITGTMIVVFIATAEEYSNKFVTARDWSLGDLTANYLGIVCLGMLPFWRPQLFSRTESEFAADDSATPHDPAAR